MTIRAEILPNQRNRIKKYLQTTIYRKQVKVYKRISMETWNPWTLTQLFLSLNLSDSSMESWWLFQSEYNCKDNVQNFSSRISHLQLRICSETNWKKIPSIFLSRHLQFTPSLSLHSKFWMLRERTRKLEITFSSEF